MDATLVIPALNEEESLGYVLEAVDTDLLSEIILVDGGSSDRTIDIAREYGACVVQEPRRGYGRACATGVAHAQGEIVIFLDADGADDPRQIPSLITPILREGADLVLVPGWLAISTPVQCPGTKNLATANVTITYFQMVYKHARSMYRIYTRAGEFQL